jgi:hypothetical protein
MTLGMMVYRVPSYSAIILLDALPPPIIAEVERSIERAWGVAIALLERDLNREPGQDCAPNQGMQEIDRAVRSGCRPATV